MQEPTDPQIIEALESSGFLFEQECATALEALHFHVETSWPFEDVDEGKSRELDLRAFRMLHHDKAAKMQVFVELLVECKDFEAPLVFLERPKNARELTSAEPAEYQFPIRYQTPSTAGGHIDVSGFQHFNLAPSHYYYREPNKATQFVKIVRKGSRWHANHDGIHDAIVLPLAKALEARRATWTQGRPGPSDWCFLPLYFPIVVVRNRLLVHAPGASEPLVERGRVSYVRALESKALRGAYMIDFVRFEYLQQYIETEVLAFANVVKDLAASRPYVIRGRS